MTLIELIELHAAHARLALPAEPGFDPRDGVPPPVELDEAGRRTLMRRGIEVIDAPGPGCRVHLAEPGPDCRLKVSFRGRAGCVLVVEPGGSLSGRVQFEGDGHLCVLRAGVGVNALNLTFRNRDGLLLFGRGCSARSVDILVEGPRTAVYVGADAMISRNVQIRTSDSHGIVDLSSGEVLNRPRGVVIGAHVWLGQDCIVMPGVTVGAGSIIGARAVVTKAVPARSIAVGVPARIVRRDVSWTRASQPDADAVRSLLASPLLGVGEQHE